ncbi:putative manganese transporter, partial [Coprobacillus cateniformis]|uniref:putative manganese transporter n=1 Tax=Coprobacillus cateniformis TaxID=100884 RepID=UPI00399FC33F
LVTLISVFIATSDEAIPILLTSPELYSSLLEIIIFKFILAILIGYLVDVFIKENHLTSQKDTHDHCHNHSLFIEAFLRTIKIYAFIFVVNFILSAAIEMIGTDQLSYILLDNSLLQPVVSAIFGFIPNCAASVILTQLYMNQALSFASLLAGLITNAGLGILVLLQNKVNTATILKICLILLMSALFVSLPLQWLHLH